MRKSALLIIFLIVFIDLVGFGIVIPILPYYAQSYGASAFELGWLMAIYSLMQFLVAPVWGRLSDRVGRRPVLLVSLLGTGLSMLWLGFAETLLTLFLARLAAGICGANISTAYAYIADVTDESNRAKGMGMIGAAFGLGFILGPAIGGLLSPYGYSVPMFAGAALALANLVFAWFRLEEPRLSEQVRASHRSRRFDLATLRLGLSEPRTRTAVGLFFLVTFAHTQMESAFAIFLKAQYGLTAQSAGILLAIVGVFMVAIQGGLIGKLVKRFGEVRLVIAGLVLCIVGLTGFAAVSALFSLVVFLIVLAIGHGMLHPTLSALASMGAAPDRRGAVMGVFQSSGSLARVFGPPSAGWLFDHVSIGSPFYGGAGVLVVALVITLATAAVLAGTQQAAPTPDLSSSTAG